jgi:hypothetical protein
MSKPIELCHECFDFEYYRAHNPDVYSVFGTDNNKLWSHWNSHGKQENRPHRFIIEFGDGNMVRGSIDELKEKLSDSEYKLVDKQVESPSEAHVVERKKSFSNGSRSVPIQYVNKNGWPERTVKRPPITDPKKQRIHDSLRTRGISEEYIYRYLERL